MIATFNPCSLHGTIDAPPSKSMAHRYLIGAALSGKKCTLRGVDFSEDILASIDCLTALGTKITIEKNTLKYAWSHSPETALKHKSIGFRYPIFVPTSINMLSVLLFLPFVFSHSFLYLFMKKRHIGKLTTKVTNDVISSYWFLSQILITTKTNKEIKKVEIP